MLNEHALAGQINLFQKFEVNNFDLDEMDER